MIDVYLKEVVFFKKNSFPKMVWKEWEKEPEDGQRVEVDYGNEKNNNVWWENGKFVNFFGAELHNIIGWRPYP
jgi:hypothetical protein